MAIVEYPSSFEQRVLKQEAPGGQPAEINLVIPSVIKPGVPFDAKLSLLDEVGYPSVCCDAPVKVTFTDGNDVTVEFSEGQVAVALIKGAVVNESGYLRATASYGGQVTYSNPAICSNDVDTNLYWGDPHVHTHLSRCHPTRCRSLNFCFIMGKYGSGLDWTTAADHVSNGRCDISKWLEQQKVSNAHNDPGTYVTLPGYEASLKGGAGGDNNVYMSRWPEMFADDYDEGNTKTLDRKLSELLEAGEYFIVPHHTTRTGKHGEISHDIYPGTEAMPVVEIHSKWGTSEYRGNPNPLQEIHDGPSYVTDLLDSGLPLGFVAGTDSHASMASGRGIESPHIMGKPGITAVMANSLDRQSIFDGIRNRSCYACSQDRIVLRGDIAGQSFGALVQTDAAPSPRRIKVDVAAKSDIVSVELVKNGETVDRLEPKGWLTEYAYEDSDQSVLHSPVMGEFSYYYIRVTCENGSQAWSSPVWFCSKLS